MATIDQTKEKVEHITCERVREIQFNGNTKKLQR